MKMRTQCCGVMITGQCNDCPYTAPVRPANIGLPQDVAAYQQRITELEADKARLREALQQMVNYARAEGKGLRIADEALAATSSTWLADRLADERRKVVDEILNEAQGPNKDAYIHSEHIAEVVCRMAKGNRR
jgi:hypothetical protein